MKTRFALTTTIKTSLFAVLMLLPAVSAHAQSDRGLRVSGEPAAPQPYQVRATVVPNSGGGGVVIPAGKRFVIENVSAIARKPEGVQALVDFFTYMDNNGNGVADAEDLTFHRIALTEQGTFNGVSTATANHKVLVFADERIGNDHLSLHLEGRYSGPVESAQVQVTFSGYLIDLPAVQ